MAPATAAVAPIRSGGHVLDGILPHLDQLDTCFDDTHAVANAGLPLAATLAERALSVLAAREQRWELYERLAVRAGVDLSPPQLWLLARLGERAPTSQEQLLKQLPV